MQLRIGAPEQRLRRGASNNRGGHFSPAFLLILLSGILLLGPSGISTALAAGGAPAPQPAPQSGTSGASSAPAPDPAPQASHSAASGAPTETAPASSVPSAVTGAGSSPVLPAHSGSSSVSTPVSPPVATGEIPAAVALHSSARARVRPNRPHLVIGLSPELLLEQTTAAIRRHDPAALALPRILPASPRPNGVLLLLSAIALSVLVLASSSMLRLLRRLDSEYLE